MTPAASATDSRPGGPASTNPAAGAAPRGAAVVVVVALLGTVAGAIVFGVAACLVDAFHPLATLGLAVCSGVVAGWLALRSGAGWGITAPDLLVVILAAAWLIWGAGNASQQVFTTTDPGVYVTNAWNLAEGNGPLLEIAPGVITETDGSFGLSGYHDDRGDGSLSSQFPRGLPVVLAVAYGAGGPGLLFLAPVLIATAGLLVFYMFARLYLSGWWSALATAGLALNLAFVHFGRGAYSEPLMSFLVIGACWMTLLALERPGWGWGAGMLLGAALCVRIDALVVVTVVPALAAYAVAARRPVLPWLVRVLPGLGLGAGLAVLDLLLLSPSYWQAQDRRLVMVAVLVVGTTLAAAVAPRLVRFVSTPLLARRRVLAVIGAVSVALMAVFVFAVRPFGPEAHTTTGRNDYLAILLGREGHIADPTRTMAESTGLWLWWYLGPLLIAGLAGAVLLTRRLLLRYRPEAVVVLTMAGVTAAIYLWRPSINPLQIWAMRRFLPVVVPGLTVLGVIALAAVVERIRPRGPAIAACAVAVAVGLSPGVRTLQVPATAEIPGAYDLVAAVCDDLPEDAVLFAETSSQPLVWGVALRVVCQRPVVVTRPALLPALMGEVADTGGDVLWFGVECVVAGDIVSSRAAQLPNLEQTVLRPPSHMSTDFYGVTAIRPWDLQLDCG